MNASGEVLLGIYFRVIGIIVLLVLFLGFLCPYMINAKSDVMVIAGIAELAIMPILLYLLINGIIKKVREIQNG